MQPERSLRLHNGRDSIHPRFSSSLNDTLSPRVRGTERPAPSTTLESVANTFGVSVINFALSRSWREGSQFRWQDYSKGPFTGARELDKKFREAGIKDKVTTDAQVPPHLITVDSLATVPSRGNPEETIKALYEELARGGLLAVKLPTYVDPANLVSLVQAAFSGDIKIIGDNHALTIAKPFEDVPRKPPSQNTQGFDWSDPNNLDVRGPNGMTPRQRLAFNDALDLEEKRRVLDMHPDGETAREAIIFLGAGNSREADAFNRQLRGVTTTSLAKAASTLHPQLADLTTKYNSVYSYVPQDHPMSVFTSGDQVELLRRATEYVQKRPLPQIKETDVDVTIFYGPGQVRTLVKS